MNCAEVEALLCDYVDGTLRSEAQPALRRHLATCPACAELAADVTGAVDFMERASAAEPPPGLAARIVREVPLVRPPWYQRALRSWVGPLLEPRYAMGIAMTVLSCSMFARAAAVTPANVQSTDFDLARVWTAADDQAYRAWDRSVKYVENLRWLREMQSQWRDWTGADRQAEKR